MYFIMIKSVFLSADDPRFSFLKKDHEYYPYYRCKIRLYTEVYGDIFKDGVEVSRHQLSLMLSSSRITVKDKLLNLLVATVE